MNWLCLPFAELGSERLYAILQRRAEIFVVEQRCFYQDVDGLDPQAMHLMAWDDDEGRLVTFAIPFWLLRLKSGPIELSAYSQGWNDRGVSFKIEDLERAGPGIVLDFSERDGRVLVWAE